MIVRPLPWYAGMTLPPDHFRCVITKIIKHNGQDLIKLDWEYIGNYTYSTPMAEPNDLIKELL